MNGIRHLGFEKLRTSFARFRGERSGRWDSLEPLPCVFRAMSITGSRRSRSPIPKHADRGFQAMPIADSEGSRSAIPADADHPA
jgi:hypothetical protein